MDSRPEYDKAAALTRGVELLDHAVKSFHFAKAVDDHRTAEWTLDDEGRISRMNRID